jgi:hypothetical protein
MPSFRELVELSKELVYRKVGYDKVTVLEGRYFTLATDRDHCVHVFGI